VRGGIFAHDKPAVLDLVVEGRRHTTHPDVLTAARRYLVPDALGRRLALELRKGEQDVQGQPHHGDGGFEGPRHRNEGDLVAVEYLHEAGKVGQRSRKPVDLVDDHHIGEAILNDGKELLQARTLQRAAGNAPIVIRSRTSTQPSDRWLAMKASQAASSCRASIGSGARRRPIRFSGCR